MSSFVTVNKIYPDSPHSLYSTDADKNDLSLLVVYYSSLYKM